jgi:ammonium transporter, Amt family
VGGLAGALLLGLFADSAINPAVVHEGLFLGGGVTLLGDQALASVVTLAYSFVVSLIIAKVIDLALGLRVTEEDEDTGLDLSQHAEVAYAD